MPKEPTTLAKRSRSTAHILRGSNNRQPNFSPAHELCKTARPLATRLSGLPSFSHTAWASIVSQVFQ
eukprot:6692901-Lingulodinium_polyedra.AAC.1